MQTTKPLSPVSLEKIQTTQTQNNTNQMSKMETNNTRKTYKSQNMKPKNYKLPCDQHDKITIIAGKRVFFIVCESKNKKQNENKTRTK